jgi:hypothetical protein
MSTSFRGRIAHPTLQALYDYWIARRSDRGFMRRADFDPLDIPRLLKHLILSDVGATDVSPGDVGPGDGALAIRYRVVGTEIVTAHGSDYTGKTIEELTSGATLDYTRALYGIVVGRAVPVYSEGRFRWAQKEHRWTKRLHLPLSRGGAAVDMVLAGQVFEPERTADRELMLPAEEAELTADREAAGGSPP